MRRAANHARTAIGIGAAFEHFQQKEEARPLATSRHVSPFVDPAP
jgi:hypothetical protein